MIRIVLGPPAAGKSTYVEEHRKADSVVVDFDALAQALGFAGEHDATGSVWFVTRAARVAAIRAILAGIDSDAWIIATNPTPARLQTYADAGAKFVIVDPGKDECLRRAEEQGRPSDVLAAIEDWYRHPPVPPDPSKRAKAMNGRNIGIEAMADSVFDAMRSYVGREVGAVASSIRPVSGQLEQITLSLGVLQTATEAMRLQLAELGELRTMILARVEKLEAVEPIPGPPGPAGPAGPEGPAGRDGADGQNGETGPAGAPGPQGEQGPEGPAGRDGRDGIDGAKGEDGRPGETGPAGPEGPQGPAGDAGAIGERGPEGPAGVAGRDGRDGLPGPRGEVGPAGEAGPAGPEGPQGEKGMQGRDGISPDGFSVDREGHVLWFRLKAGDSVFNASVNAPTFIDRGVWKAGETYEPGDAVSWGGSLFLCQRETAAKPETNDDWRLGVKRGRDGKDGKDGKPGERGPAGPAGRDLTQLGTDGSKW